VAPARFSYLAYTTSGLALCAVNKWNGKTLCSMTSFPYFPGVQISYLETEISATEKIGYSLLLNIPDSFPDSSLHTSGFNAIKARLSSKIGVARDELRTRLSMSRPSTLSASRLAIEQDEEEEEVQKLDPIVVVGSSSSSGGVLVFPTTFYNPYDGEIIGELAIADGACAQTCTKEKEHGDSLCRAKTSRSAKAICWGANMAKYGACLAACPKD
jgi:hypothetical protein